MTGPMKSPQLDDIEFGWTHVSETIRMLFLAIAQIEIALRESDDSIEHLTEAFITVVDKESNIAKSIDRLQIGDGEQEIRDSIKADAQVVTEKMQSAIVAFQFYDKLTQRLSHVGSSMEELSVLLKDEQRINLTAEWQILQEKIKSKYSMREEGELFNAVMAGGEIREAIRRYNEMPRQDCHGDVELF